MSYMSELALLPEHYESAKSGYISFRIKVQGYWSQESICLRINRKYSWQGVEEGAWVAELSHSSGGRDTKEVESDLDAEINFGNALVKTAEFARIVLLEAAKFEEIYQAHRKEVADAHEAKMAAQRAAAELDAPMSASDAKKFVLRAIAGAKSNSTGKAAIRTFVRGTDRKVVFTVTAYDRAVIRNGNGRVVPSKDLIEELSDELSGNRTTLDLDVK